MPLSAFGDSHQAKDRHIHPTVSNFPLRSSLRMKSFSETDVQSLDHEHYALATLVGHTDAVWSLTTLPHPITPMFASSSADGTIRLWDIAAALQTSASAALKHVIQVKKLCNATPTSVRGGWTEGQVVVGRSDGKISLFDVAGGASKEACVFRITRSW